MNGSSASDRAIKRVYANFIWSAVALVVIHVIGTIGYRVIGGPKYSWIDCFYMTFITIASIGYGEIVDLADSPGGRIFTVFIAIAGIAVLTYLMSAFMAYLVEGKINEALRRKRMEKDIHRLKEHYIICGIGRVGTYIANELAATNRTYVAVDENTDNITAFIEKHPNQMYIHGDASDDDILLKAHIETAAGVFAVTGDDSKNLLIMMSAKQLNPATRTVARCHDIRNAEKMRKAGADGIVSPEFTGGMRIASTMIRPHVVSFLDEMLKSDGRLRVEEVVVPAGFPKTRLTDLNLGGRECLLLALHEAGRWIFNPEPVQTIQPGMALVVMATPEGRKSIESALRGS